MEKIRKIIVALCIALIVWGIASWIDVISTNTKPNAEQASWNLFEVLKGEEKE